MHKTRSRRNDIIVRALTYFVMTIAVIFLALVCLFIVLGYSFDKKTGTPEQGGLIQFRSFPENANVIVDGQPQGFTTPNKKNTDADAHNVRMVKKDYRNWSKSFTLERGELLWLNARLVPTSITTEEVEQFDSLHQIMASPDKKWIVAIEKANVPELKIIDIRDEKNPKPISLKIPASIMNPPTPADTFSVNEWDFGSRYILVEHTSPTGSEWLRIDRSDESNVENITDIFKHDFNELHFAGNSGNNFYALSGGDLRKLALGQTELPPVISQDISELGLYGDNKLAFITKKNNQESIYVYRDGDESPVSVQSFSQGQGPIHVALTSFFGSDYVGISYGTQLRLVKDPFGNAPVTAAKVTLPSIPKWVYFSGNGQFLVAQNDAAMTTYNLERDQTSRFTVPGKGPYARTAPLEWIDDFRFWSDMDGTLRMFEFDGTNREVISNVMAGHDVTLSDNGKRLFSIGLNATTKKPVLQSSLMVVE